MKKTKNYLKFFVVVCMNKYRLKLLKNVLKYTKYKEDYIIFVHQK